jgi:putative toxin-antitoxin system antitoxin component (TIGR02293 family)
MATVTKSHPYSFSSITNLELAEKVHRGIPAATLLGMASDLGIGVLELADTLRLARRTVTRRLAQDKKLTPDESEKILRVGRLLRIAEAVFDGRDQAFAWFMRPLSPLNGRTPLQECSSEPGGREVEQVLGRIDHGIVG